MEQGTADPDTRRSSIGRRIRAHPLLFGSGAAVGVAIVTFVLVWFQPQALLFDRVVDEDFPTVVDPDTDAGEAEEAAGRQDDAVPDADPAPEPEPPAPVPEDEGDDTSQDVGGGDADEAAETEPVLLATGGFSSRNRYTVDGDAHVYALPDGSRVLRFEDFESTNGPDLFVYLAAADEADGDPDLFDDYVDLGVLKGNIGAQNYDIPDDVDLDHYDTVVIWCLRFTVGFGAADLATAG